MVGCPQGDAGTIAFTVQLYPTDGILLGDPGLEVTAVRDSSHGSGIRVWEEQGNVLHGVYSSATQQATFAASRISGCGEVGYDVYAAGQLVARDVAFGLRSLDFSDSCLGYVDQFDVNELVGAMGTAGACTDLDTDGDTDSLDLNWLAGHIGHHRPQTMAASVPEGVFAQGGSMPVHWQPTIGGAAKVSIMLTRDGTPGLITPLAEDRADDGDDTCTVFAADAPRSDYRIKVLWTAGAYQPGGASVIDSAMSNSFSIAAPPDTVPPATVLDLSAERDPEIDNEWHLRWTASADDSNYAASGPATAYDIRTLGAPITAANWGQAEPAGGPSPGTPGMTDEMTLLVTNRTYLRLKVRDVAGNYSGLSRQVMLEPFLAGGEGMFAEGGGGGGFSVQRAPGALSLQGSRGGAPPGNTLFDGVTSGTPARDLLRMDALAAEGTNYVARIRQAAGSATSLDQVQVLAVDHTPGLQALAVDGRVILGQEVGPRVARDGSGAEVTSSIDRSGAVPLAADSGVVLTVEFEGDSGTRARPVVIEASDRSGPMAGILLEVPDGGGDWRPVARLHPRQFFDVLTVDSVPPGPVRLRFLSVHQVRFVGRFALAEEAPQVQLAGLVAAQSSRLGDVAEDVSAADSAAVAFSGPDTLLLTFSLPPLDTGLVRQCFLAVGATPLGLRAAGGFSMMRAQAVEVLPTRFALHQNQPNPFAGTTAIRFDLPVAASVRLEIFDAQGRRVRTLANRVIEPGYQSLIWDQRSDAGSLVRPGVYLYRLQAGSSRAQKKMVLLAP